MSVFFKLVGNTCSVFESLQIVVKKFDTILLVSVSTLGGMSFFGSNCFILVCIVLSLFSSVNSKDSIQVFSHLH